MPIPFLSSINLTKNEVENFKIYNLANDPGTLTSGGDYGYFWLNTTNSGGTIPTLKWWDGTNVRSLVDSTNIGSFTSGLATDLAGGGAGQIVYQDGANDTKFLAAGTAGQVLSSNGSSAPSWLNQSSLSVGSATNKTGGNLGDILVQSGSGTTSFLSAGTAGQVITSNGASPQYVNQSTLSVGSATTATTATNVAGGANGSILVQSGAGTTGQLAIGASGYILTSNGTTPGWSASIPSTSVSGLAASATTDTTNASNISSGTLGLARLSLATGQFYVGDASNNPAATAKSSIPLSGFGAAGADVAMGGFKITGLADPAAATDAATRGYVDSVAQGLDVKASCLVATTADITLASPGAVTIDGIYSATDFTAGTTRILVKDQSAPAENGIYIWQGPAAAMTRSADADTWDELVGAFTFIERGTANADSGWVCSVNAGGTLGSTAVTWVKFSQAGSYTQGRGMVLDGTAFNFAQNTNYTTNTIPYASGATTIGFIGAGTADQVLRVPGAGGTPAFGAIDLTKSAAVTGALPAANGGTGQSSYAVGDILFADSATSLAKLADVATGNALISGGVTTAPSWGKIGLTTHVSGTLPVGNGGTGATSFTQGQVLFAGASTISSSANLFWDAANNRLGIGTATPASALDVVGTGIISQNLGIGAAPSYKLHVTQGDLNSYVVFQNNQTLAQYRSMQMVLGNGPSVFGANNRDWRVLNVASSATASDFVVDYWTGTAISEKFKIASDGVCTWSNVGGVAGTAMTLNGTGLGVGTDPTGFGRLVVRGTAAGAGYLGVDSDATRVDIQSYNKPLAINRSGNNVLFCEGGGNVGIGTATPQAKLSVETSGVQNTISPVITAQSTGTTYAGMYSVRDGAGDQRGLVWQVYTVNVGLGEKMRLDSSGNLGLGVTPSAWKANHKAIQFGPYSGSYGTLYVDDSGNSWFGELFYQGTSNRIYTGTGNAAAYRLTNTGQHQWYTDSVGGVAGGTVSLTQAMTLDASGNLALGTSTANFRADIQNASGAAVLRLKGGTGAAQGSAVYMTYAGGANTLLGIGDRATILGGTPDQLACIYSGVALTFEISGAERLRLKTTGQLNFNGLASDPAGAAGDVYYNSGSNVFKVYDTGWKTLPRKYVVQLSDGSVTVAGNAYTITHNLGSQDVTVSIRRTTDNAVVQADVVMPAGGNTVTVTFAAAITAAQFYVTVIG